MIHVVSLGVTVQGLKQFHRDYPGIDSQSKHAQLTSSFVVAGTGTSVDGAYAELLMPALLKDHEHLTEHELVLISSPDATPEPACCPDSSREM